MRVVEIDIPFASMVRLIVKWVLAGVVAAVLFGAVGACVGGLLWAGRAALGAVVEAFDRSPRAEPMAPERASNSSPPPAAASGALTVSAPALSTGALDDPRRPSAPDPQVEAFKGRFRQRAVGAVQNFGGAVKTEPSAVPPDEPPPFVIDDGLQLDRKRQLARAKGLVFLDPKAHVYYAADCAGAAASMDLVTESNAKTLGAVAAKDCRGLQ